MKAILSFIFALSILILLQSAHAQDSLNVRRLGQLAYPPGELVTVTVTNGFAYCADSESGLRIIHVEDPENIEEVGFFNTPGFASDVAVSGEFAYVADGDSGLRIINISNPSDPAEIGFIDTPDLAKGVVVSGNFAYVADQDGGGLRIINISNPAVPVEVGFYDTPGFANKVAVAGNFAYVADDFEGLRIIDISDPANPDEIGFLVVDGDSRDVALSGNLAYTADQSGGFHVIDISNPASPAELGDLDLPGGNAWGITVSGNFVYLAYEVGGLRVINVSNPANPVEVGFYNTSGFTYDVAVIGHIAYVADYTFLGVYEFLEPSDIGEPFIGTVPISIELLPCYPNPFNARTTISFSLSKQAVVVLSAYDIQGRISRQIANQTYSAGTHSLYFDAGEFSTGVYFVKMNSEAFSRVQKMVLLK